MSSKKKKKNPVMDRKNLIVIAIATVFVAAIAFVMSSLIPKEKAEDFEQVAWEEAISKAESDLEEKYADRGLTSVYTEPAVATTSDALPAGEEEEESEESDESEETETVAEAPKQPEEPQFMRPSAGEIVKDYSGDELVYSATMQDWRTHNGIDFATQIGDVVVAAADGTVEAITNNSMMGTTVILLHDGGLRTIYSNLDENVVVNTGAEIVAGTAVGMVGDTAAAESAEEPHLHFEVSLNEETVNPHEYIGE